MGGESPACLLTGGDEFSLSRMEFQNLPWGRSKLIRIIMKKESQTK